MAIILFKFCFSAIIIIIIICFVLFCLFVYLFVCLLYPLGYLFFSLSSHINLKNLCTEYKNTIYTHQIPLIYPIITKNALIYSFFFAIFSEIIQINDEFFTVAVFDLMRQFLQKHITLFAAKKKKKFNWLVDLVFKNFS